MINIQINSHLTPESAKNLGYSYTQDFHLDLENLAQTDPDTLQDIVEGMLLGQPLNEKKYRDINTVQPNEVVVGLYWPIYIEEKKEPIRSRILVDTELTAENAPAKGFEWWTDSLYNPELDILDEFIEDDLNADLHEMIQEGWKLGSPAYPHLNERTVGIYKPLSTVKKS